VTDIWSAAGRGPGGRAWAAAEGAPSGHLWPWARRS